MKYVCLLRGVNVSGQRKVNMKVLCTELSDLGLTDVEYYLQSGNLIVESELSEANIEATITGVLRDNYDYQDVDLFLFDHAQLASIHQGMLAFFSVQDNTKRHFTFLKNTPAEQIVSMMDEQEYAPDEYRIKDKMVYVYCPNGYGRTKIHNNYFERKLKVRATTRNHKTVTTLLEKLTTTK